MRLPIDTSRLQFLVVSEAEPLKQYEEGKPREAWAPRIDTNGEVLWRLQLVAMGDNEAEIIKVAVPGDPGVKATELVRVEGMTAQAWEMEGRNGMAFRAAAIRSASVARARRRRRDAARDGAARASVALRGRAVRVERGHVLGHLAGFTDGGEVGAVRDAGVRWASWPPRQRWPPCRPTSCCGSSARSRRRDVGALRG